MPYVTNRIGLCAASFAIAVSLVSLTACGGSKKSLAGVTTEPATSSVQSSPLASDSISSAPTEISSADTSSDSTDSAARSSAASAPAASSPVAGASGGGAKCIDLSDASASAALGKKATVKAEAATHLAGLTICDVTIVGEIYPIQLDVNSANASALFTADRQVSFVASLTGLGDMAFRSSIGVEALSAGVDIKVIGPAGPVLNNDFTVPTALVKAMIAAIH